MQEPQAARSLLSIYQGHGDRFGARDGMFGSEYTSLSHMQQCQQETVLSVISRLPDALTLVVNEAWVCEMCSVFCGRSQDPLLRDLARRIVCEPVPLNDILV